MANSVEKTMAVLQVLSEAQGRAVTLAKLSETLRIPKSTLSHILKTLAEGRYVLRVSHREGYILGPELYYLARARFGEELIMLCRPLLRRIYRESGGTVVLAIIRGTRKYIIDYINGVGYYGEQGKNSRILSDGVYRTVTGRVLLAYMPEYEALEIFEKLGVPKSHEWEEIHDRKSFLAQLETIRAQKCYRKQYVENRGIVLAFAVPIFQGGSCLGALGLSVVEDATSPTIEQEKARLCRLLIRCRVEAERRLSFEVDPSSEKTLDK